MFWSTGMLLKDNLHCSGSSSMVEVGVDKQEVGADLVTLQKEQDMTNRRLFQIW